MALTSAQIKAYLDRIGFQGRVETTVHNLVKLQNLHFLSVPFENIDLFVDKRISLDIDELHEKIVVNNRGGLCYEVNGLFHRLLRSLGFNAHLISTEVYIGPHWISHRNSHLAIPVHDLKVEGSCHFVDVGCGMHKALYDPFLLDLGAEYEQVNRHIKVTKERSGSWLLLQRGKAETNWEPYLRFSEDYTTLQSCQEMVDAFENCLYPDMLVLSAIPIVFLKADKGNTVLSIIGDTFRKASTTRGSQNDTCKKGLHMQKLTRCLKSEFGISIPQNSLAIPGKEHPFYKA